MLFLIAIILFVLWLTGWLVVNIGGNLVHVLLVIALVLVIYRLATGKKVV